MESEILTPDELVALTGHKQPKAQKEWLDNNGIHYLVNGKHRPVVGRHHAREVLRGCESEENHQHATSEQDTKAHRFSYRGLNK